MKAKKTHLLAALFTVWCFLVGCAVAIGIVTVWGQALGRLFTAPIASELLSGRVRFGTGMAFMAVVAHLCAHIFPRSVPTFTRTLFYFAFSAAVCTALIWLVRGACIDFVDYSTYLAFGPAPTTQTFPLFTLPAASSLVSLFVAVTLRFAANRLFPHYATA
jgi:hypothetical protein